ncbi:adenylate/guanylate cyclase domain-containing protein [Bacillus cereus]|uniref:adenylate/guanylate cyclase domain-containing protein n=1 Tax=Bacillus cereus group TaxID=86661 RepID=UPI000BEFC100|nr:MULTISPECIES: adenylate/guanylate cyclase domain-containing protein [Bacillus cereus group]MCC2367956.1 adenylate/guanylate cyclase domain-containing protein [Bacillus cereus]MCC2489530.1 adenylate/guanylate cyclase domain-containing protein [Bacillus cereus]MCU5449750.1 adenylate/guanylate cyclase domain-containing protein [Bacillus cereus]MCU5628876.1 adenylate/guanylate cyclase domain-containing protein [Bacillus cereus]MDF9457503.1 adenylate/guanylate cyclase domain-containing protein [
MDFKDYDYKERKKKVEEILDNTDKVNEVDKFPRDEDFTYTNGYKAWAGAIFVDLRDSTTLFSGENDVDIAKVIRGFTSEIIEILRKDTDNDLKEIGIRGDCVYAVYSAPLQNDIYDIANRAFHINTYMKMLNKLLEERNLPTIKAGIGLATNKTLAVKAGRKSSAINNLVWIGESVTIAAKLSDLGNKNGIGAIVMSSTFYSNYIEVQKKLQPNDSVENWWTRVYDSSYGTYYHGKPVKISFNKWIDDGMND